MQTPGSMKALEELGRVRLSANFFMRDFLYSEIANFYGIPNIPDDPDLAIKAGERLCQELLEPLQETFGRLAVRSAYRSPTVNKFGNGNKLNCASNEKNYAAHIWDRRDGDGCMGATACIVVPWVVDRPNADWRSLAWWIHDHLPYSSMVFYPKLFAFNLQWHERPRRTIKGAFPPYQGYLTKPGMSNHEGSHAEWYEGFPKAGNGPTEMKEEQAMNERRRPGRKIGKQPRASDVTKQSKRYGPKAADFANACQSKTFTKAFVESRIGANNFRILLKGFVDRNDGQRKAAIEHSEVSSSSHASLGESDTSQVYSLRRLD